MKPVSILSLAFFVFLQVFPTTSRSQNLAIQKDVTEDTYLVSGQSLRDIHRNLSKKGPNGFWGLAEWYVSWNEDCDVTFRAKITLPKFVCVGQLSDGEKNAIEDMLRALTTHEKKPRSDGLVRCRRNKETQLQ